MRRQVALSFKASWSTPVARGPSRKTQWDSNPQPLNTCMSGGAGSTELSPTPTNSPNMSRDFTIHQAINVPVH